MGCLNIKQSAPDVRPKFHIEKAFSARDGESCFFRDHFRVYHVQSGYVSLDTDQNKGVRLACGDICILPPSTLHTLRANTSNAELYVFRWQEMATGIKTELVTALTDVLTLTNQIKESWLGQIGETIFDAVYNKIDKVVTMAKMLLKLQMSIGNAVFGGGGEQQHGTGTLPSNVRGIGQNLVFQGYQSAYGSPIPTTGTPSQIVPPKANPKGGNKPDKLIDAKIKAARGFETLAPETWDTYESMAELRKALSRYQTMLDNATNGGQELAAIAGINETKWKMSDTGRQAAKLGLDQNAFKDLQQQIEEGIAGMNFEPIKIDVSAKGVENLAEDGKNISAAWSTAGSVIRSVGSAIQNLENPTGKIVAIVAQAIANIAAGYAAAIGKEGAQSKNIWAFLASAAAAVVEMGVSIAQVHKATGYSGGGVIKGTTYSGDLIPANGGTIGLDAGELILNRSQQNVIARELTSNNGGVSAQPYVTGEYIYLGLSNYLRQIGRGEIITSRK